MSALLGTSWPVTVGITLVLAGSAAWLSGRALAERWRSVWRVVLGAALLGAAARFLIYALFGGVLLSPSGYAIDTAALLAIALVSFRHSRARAMVRQYPWLYEPAGPLRWRARPPEGAPPPAMERNTR